MHPTRREMFRAWLRLVGPARVRADGPAVFGPFGERHGGWPHVAQKGRILVVVQLDGGNDGLNTVVPYGDDEYRKHRPKLAIAAGELKKVDDQVGLHPSLEPFSKAA